MNWVNEPYRHGRLFVQQSGFDTVRFTDIKENERIDMSLSDRPTEVMMRVVRAERGDGRTVFTGDAKHFVKGAGITERDVWHFVTREHATALRAGLTVHRSAFSSTPHDFELTPDFGFEEAFVFMMPDDAKGLLEGEGVWPEGDAVSAAWPVVNRSMAQVPMGWHRVTALPGLDGVVPPLAYVWVYLALHERWEK